jgi:hypothetical protein
VKPRVRGSAPRACRDGNSGTDIEYPLGIRSDGDRYEYDFLPVGGTRTRPEPRRVREHVFFPTRE